MSIENEEKEPNLLNDLAELQRVVNIGIKEKMRKSHPHISPDWYEIHINPKLNWDIVSLAGAVVQIHTRFIPTIHENFKEDIFRAIKRVPKLRTPMAVERYTEVLDRRNHWEPKRISVKDTAFDFLPATQVEYHVVTRVIAIHLGSGTRIEVESEEWPIHALKQQALSLLSHKVQGLDDA